MTANATDLRAKLPVYSVGGFLHIPRPMLPIVINFILAINVIVCLLIILLVLMQRPKYEGLGAAFGGGMTENLFGAQTSNVLQTITRWLGGIFFALTLLVSWLMVKKDFNRSSLQQRLSAPTVIPATPAPVIPSDVPTSLPGATTAPVKPGEAPTTPELEQSIKKMIEDAAKSQQPAPEGAKPAPAPAPAPDASKPAPAAPAPAPDAAKPAPAPEAAKPAPESAKPEPAPEAAKPAPAPEAAKPVPEAAKPVPAPEVAKPADAPAPTPEKAPEAPKP